MPTISSMADVDKRSTSLRRAASSAGDDRGDGEQDRRAGAAKQPDVGPGTRMPGAGDRQRTGHPSALPGQLSVHA